VSEHDEWVARQLLCHHEGAHAILCEVYDIPFVHAHLDRAWWGLGAIESGHVRLARDKDYTVKPLESAVMCLGGLMAERVWLEQHPGNGSVNDGNGITDALDAVTYLRNSEVSMAAALRVTREQVERHWARIERVAVALEARHHLSRSAVRNA
jgi:hypothetical protein